MSALSSLLLITALSIPVNTLVLRTGERIAIEGPIRVDGRQVIFRSGGALYTIPTDEVDLDASRTEGSPARIQAEARGNKLRVSAEERDRLLRELEEKHSGTATPLGPVNVLPAPTPSERAQMSEDEWSWRNRVRGYEEQVLRAQEDLNLLQVRAESLKSHIAGLLSLGYNPSQFTYDSTRLAYTLELIPQAELEVQRSQRVYDQFRDDARKQGVTPGWLR
jgi:chromosome segregation ATPase